MYLNISSDHSSKTSCLYMYKFTNPCVNSAQFRGIKLAWDVLLKIGLNPKIVVVLSPIRRIM